MNFVFNNRRPILTSGKKKQINSSLTAFQASHQIQVLSATAQKGGRDAASIFKKLYILEKCAL